MLGTKLLAYNGLAVDAEVVPATAVLAECILPEPVGRRPPDRFAIELLGDGFSHELGQLELVRVGPPAEVRLKLRGQIDGDGHGVDVICEIGMLAAGKYVMKRLMVKALEQAIAEIATLPDADQERIGQRLLSHVEKLRQLRAEIDKGIRSLDSGEGKPLDIEDFLKRQHEWHGRP
jgi:hypothetical protein